MDRQREREVTASAITLLVVLVIVLLMLEVEGLTVQSVVAFAVVLTAGTLCAAMGIMCARVMRVSDDRTLTASSMEGQFALLGGSIALFGVLITGVFVITTFRVQETATAVAMNVAQTTAQAAVGSHQRQMMELRDEHEGRLQDFLDDYTEAFRTLRTSQEAELDALRAEYERELYRSQRQGARRSAFLAEIQTPIVYGDTAPLDIGQHPVVWEEEQLLTFPLMPVISGEYRIEARAVGGDAYLYLYDESMNLLQQDDDSGGGFDARIERFLEDDVYYVGVEELNGRRAEGTLVVQLLQ